MDPQKRKLNRFSTLPEFVSAIIRETIPEGDYQRRLEGTAASLNRDFQDQVTLNFLPSISTGVVVEDSNKSIPITAAWQLIRLAAKLYDDVEDHENGVMNGEAINLATGLLFAAHTALEKLTDYEISHEQSQQVRTRFNRVCLQTCAGQDLDLSTRWDQVIPSPDDWLEIAREKSGELFAWASWAGNYVSGADDEMQTGFWEYGLHLGILVQIADDFNGAWSSPITNDLSACRVTLPISYAYYVSNNDERETLLELLRDAQQGSPEVISKGQNLLSTLGAQKFMLAAAQVQRQEAVEAISPCQISNLSKQRLIFLLDNAFPVLVPKP